MHITRILLMTIHTHANYTIYVYAAQTMHRTRVCKMIGVDTLLAKQT